MPNSKKRAAKSMKAGTRKQKSRSLGQKFVYGFESNTDLPITGETKKVLQKIFRNAYSQTVTELKLSDWPEDGEPVKLQVTK
jgi:hypothetical protein